jgi:uncharacterized membrane protein YfcA
MIELAWIVGSIVMGWIANQRGRNGFGWFLLSLAVSPLLSAVFLIAAGEPRPVPPTKPLSGKALGIVAAFIIAAIAVAGGVSALMAPEDGVTTVAKDRLSGKE